MEYGELNGLKLELFDLSHGVSMTPAFEGSIDGFIPRARRPIGFCHR